MKYGIIDIGSNTIHTVVYEVENGHFAPLFSEKDPAEIIAYVKNGALSEEGIQKLVSVLVEMRELCELTKCDQILCFATASLRDVRDIEPTLARVKELSGVEVEQISGEVEALCDYLGLRLCIKEEEGAGMDLGGGSCQLFEFNEKGIRSAESLRCGSFRMFSQFVGEIFPTKKEQNAIRDHVDQLLEARCFQLKNLPYDTLYAIGGTARAAAKLHRALSGRGKPEGHYQISINGLDDLCDIVRDLGTEGTRTISRVIPERLSTILPGIIVIRTICRFIGAKRIVVVKNGVREGYLWRTILKNQLKQRQ